MTAKLGLRDHDDVPAPVVDEVLAMLRDDRVDYTSFWRQLAHAARGDLEPVRALFTDVARLDAWVDRWRELAPDADSMDRVNPAYIPRNHLVEEALTAATGGDLDPLERLLAAVTAPYDERPDLERYAAPAPAGFGPYQTFCGT